MTRPDDPQTSTGRDHVAAAVAIVLDLIPDTWDDAELLVLHERGGLRLEIGNHRHRLPAEQIPPELQTELEQLYALHAADDEAWQQLRITITYDFDQDNWRYDLERLFSA